MFTAGRENFIAQQYNFTTKLYVPCVLQFDVSEWMVRRLYESLWAAFGSSTPRAPVALNFFV